MAKVKTYWDEIKNNETNYYGGDRGWEVRLRRDSYYDKKVVVEKTRLVYQWPFSVGDGVPRSEKSKCRKDVLFARFKQKTLASASSNRNEYHDLCQRVGSMNEEEFREAIGNMSGFDLRNYICNKYWTRAESFASFYRC
jgi:2-hydroxy-3-keto-5-methylthiopentenyl-1-phosphate phosphatase